MAEKRTYQRARVNMKVDYSYDNHTNNLGRVIDISKGGMFVQTNDTPGVSAQLMASIDAEDFGKVIWIEGRVVRTTSTGMAVMFTNIDEKGLDNLLLSVNS